MLHKQRDDNGCTLVTFSLPYGRWAERVHLVGEFNNWNETATPMQQTKEGWKVTIPLPCGRSFQFRYLVDGNTWINDWFADYYVPNELDGHNSVVLT